MDGLLQEQTEMQSGASCCLSGAYFPLPWGVGTRRGSGAGAGAERVRWHSLHAILPVETPSHAPSGSVLVLIPIMRSALKYFDVVSSHVACGAFPQQGQSRNSFCTADPTAFHLPTNLWCPP